MKREKNSMRIFMFVAALFRGGYSKNVKKATNNLTDCSHSQRHLWRITAS